MEMLNNNCLQLVLSYCTIEELINFAKHKIFDPNLIHETKLEETFACESLQLYKDCAEFVPHFPKLEFRANIAKVFDTEIKPHWKTIASRSLSEYMESCVPNFKLCKTLIVWDWHLEFWEDFAKYTKKYPSSFPFETVFLNVSSIKYVANIHKYFSKKLKCLHVQVLDLNMNDFHKLKLPRVECLHIYGDTDSDPDPDFDRHAWKKNSYWSKETDCPDRIDYTLNTNQKPAVTYTLVPSIDAPACLKSCCCYHS